MADDFLTNFAISSEKAEKLKALAHPVRLCIVRGLLQAGSCNVTHMQGCLNLPQSTISQHLAKLRAARLIEGVRNGLEVYYKVVDDDVARLIATLF